jgi:hypothetical protein
MTSQSFGDRVLIGIPGFGLYHILGWAIVAAGCWLYIGYMWDDYRGRMDNETRVVIIGLLGGIVGGIMWPLIAVLVYYAILPVGTAYTLFKAGRRAKKIRNSRPIVGAVINDPYIKRAEQEVEAVLTEDSWMQQFKQKKLTRGKKG